jgi:hypothetical protein
MKFMFFLDLCFNNPGWQLRKHFFSKKDIRERFGVEAAAAGRRNKLEIF